MLINDSKCKCGDCMRDGYCPTQKLLGYLQMVTYNLKLPDLVLAMYVEECEDFKEKQQ